MVLSVWLAGHYFGASTSFVRSAGLIERVLSPDHVARLEYFGKTTPKIDWQWMFVVGILIGSLAASTISNTYKVQAVPDMWQGRFGSKMSTRGMIALVGGTVAMLGARLADG
jgi:hypothetical protein